MIKIKIFAVLLLILSFSETKAQRVVFNLISKMDLEPQYELWDGNRTRLMGFTKLFGTPISLPSPTLIFNEGDSIEIRLRNMSQSAPHTIHLHGLDVNQVTDGVPQLSFSIPHDSTGAYIFKAPHAGTYLYHCHVISTVHVQAGMYGVIIVKPPGGEDKTWKDGYVYQQEKTWMMSELDTFWHQQNIIHMPGQHDHSAGANILDYNPTYFLVNGKSETELIEESIKVSAKANEIVYLRLVNIGYYGNRIIFPTGLNVTIVSSDGRPLPISENKDTLEVFPGERYGALLKPTQEFLDNIEVEYFDLNSQKVHNTQNVPLEILGFLNNRKIEKGSFNIYPNPLVDKLYLSFPQDVKYGAVTIYSAHGRSVLITDVTLAKPMIDLSELTNGTYFIQFTSKEKSYYRKIVKTQ